MLKINLLPERFRKPEPSMLEQIHRMPLTWIIGALMALLMVGLVVKVAVQQRQANAVQEQLQLLQPRKAVVDQLQQLVQKLQDEESAYRQLHQDYLWAKRLQKLADATPEGIWFTTLSWSRATGLQLQGVAIQADGTEMGKISQLVQDLKADPSVASELQDIKIDAIKRTQDEEIELVAFTLMGVPVALPEAGKK